MPLLVEFLAARFETIVEFVEVLLGLGNQSFEPLDRFPFETAALVFGVLNLSPVDQGVQADFDVSRDFLDFAGSLARPAPQARG